MSQAIPMRVHENIEGVIRIVSDIDNRPYFEKPGSGIEQNPAISGKSGILREAIV
jgi:hypothetical protein